MHPANPREFFFPPARIMSAMALRLPFQPPLEHMLARLDPDIPVGPQWLYEPKWDGFRALVFFDGDAIFLQSRDLKPLGRYFPELEESLKQELPGPLVLDGATGAGGSSSKSAGPVGSGLRARDLEGAAGTAGSASAATAVSARVGSFHHVGSCGGASVHPFGSAAPRCFKTRIGMVSSASDAPP